MSIGIYCIRNLVNNKVYIGQSQNIEARWTQEKSGMVGSVYNKSHPLTNSFKKHGLHNFEFIILEICSVEQLDTLEIQWIRDFDSFNLEKGYNLTDGGGGSRGYKHTEEYRQALVKRNTGRKHTIRTCEKISSSSKSGTTETKERISNSLKGRIHGATSLETRDKIRIANTGKTHSEESKLKISASLKRKSFSESHRLKLKEAWSRRKSSSEEASI